nr:RNA-dependent RNA polymerase [Coprinus comatus partitivirus 1]
MSPSLVVDSPVVPAPNAPVGVTAVVDQSRDLVAERDAERKTDQIKANKKVSRFEARRVTDSIPRPPAQPEFETLILNAAVNNPLEKLKDMTVSGYIPNSQVLFLIINYMDTLMASTKRWTDNCMGWAPPISQMYFAMVFYLQILRASDAAGTLSPTTGLRTVLDHFCEIYPLSQIMIPGPLVAAFKSISAFWPSASDRFGNVTPAIPARPGWSAARRGTLAVPSSVNLPNISLYITRLRNVCNTAIQATTETEFLVHPDGPAKVSTYFGNTMDDQNIEQWLFSGPGANLAYPGNLRLWQNAATGLNLLSIPADLTPTSAYADHWSAAFRLDNQEHLWFGPVTAVMAKYSQFFKGSVPLSECSPTGSAAGAVKLTTNATNGHNSAETPTFVAAVAADAANHIAAVAAHRVLFARRRAVFDASVAIEDIPDANIFSALTFAMNWSYDDAAHIAAQRNGPFWNVTPDTHSRRVIETLPGILSTVMREYHSDSRIDASKQ